ncbi:hypothetical protein PR048_021472 [Dryococelus australis]|uniref:Integrase catalytic domain-containing protein n=1 Tax=Dryococelus australis TaxID=614101 RepID=A0ABQ9GYA6_9NEOP|nr:hypothetical protein PR048_021472 [Dryococelus australis]
MVMSELNSRCQVIGALVAKWNGIKIVHGKPRHSQSQGSVERTNQDVRDSLVAWMKDTILQFEEEISYFARAEYFHSPRTSAPQSEIPLCHLCSNKSAIETSRKHCKRGLQEQAEKMLQTSGKKFPPASTGHSILVSIPDVDRGRPAPRNELTVIMEEVEPNIFSIGTKHGKFETIYSRNEFLLAPNKSLEISDVPAGNVTVRQEAMLASGYKKGFVRCS